MARKALAWTKSAHLFAIARNVLLRFQPSTVCLALLAHNSITHTHVYIYTHRERDDRQTTDRSTSFVFSHNYCAMLSAAVYAYLCFSVASAVLIDAQAILPSALYEWGPKHALPFWVKLSGDCLMVPTAAPPWFESLVLCELIMQLPLLLYLIYAIPKGSSYSRPAAMLYGVHVATTLVPIFAHFLTHAGQRLCATTLSTYSPKSPPTQNNVILLSAYGPFFVMPAVVAYCACTGTGPFTGVPWPTAEPATRRSSRLAKKKL